MLVSGRVPSSKTPKVLRTLNAYGSCQKHCSSQWVLLWSVNFSGPITGLNGRPYKIYHHHTDNTDHLFFIATSFSFSLSDCTTDLAEIARKYPISRSSSPLLFSFFRVAVPSGRWTIFGMAPGSCVESHAFFQLNIP